MHFSHQETKDGKTGTEFGALNLILGQTDFQNTVFISCILTADSGQSTATQRF
jgi:hypothetical protein